MLGLSLRLRNSRNTRAPILPRKGLSLFRSRHLGGFSKVDEDGVPSREVQLSPSNIIITV